MSTGKAQKCAIYCRLSREDADRAEESESIANQRALLMKYASERGWEVGGVYCDEDYSGADAERPAFLRMLEAAEAGRFNIVLCKTQSRFTRDMELVEKLIHRAFPQWGVRFVAACDGADTEVRGNKKARQINGLVNEWYLEDLSDNIRMVLNHKRSEGQYIGGSALYGYKKDPGNKNALVADGEAAAVVRRIFALCLRGEGAAAIAGVLNAEGVPNPTCYKKGTGNAGWSRGTVRRILKNEMYTGTMVQGRRRKESYKSKRVVGVPEAQWFRVEGTHEAIVDRETFAAAQRILLRRAKTGKKREKYALAGLVRCLGCGGPMSKTSNGHGGGEREYLRCRRAMEGRGCTRHALRLDLLTELVEARVRAHLDALGVSGEELRLGLWDAKAAEARKELKNVFSRLERADAALAEAYMDRVGGRLEGEAFTALRARILDERAHLEHRRDTLTGTLAELPPEDGGEDLMSGRLPREVFLSLIEKIEIGERESAAGTQEIRISWRF